MSRYRGLLPPVSTRRDDEFTDYVTARLPWLRRAAYLLCHESTPMLTAVAR